ncbi:N-methylhydantoinase A/oxoprolinase/acetone carboxylase beta subunit [Stella humosa]|uniref:N-methylhydantoinase A/oxoprolinase/acetone carboxylase beta subunit n=1 Tax=Stella humosa TaxID=94 RepID=A0A3N1M2S6_9PROT|nr:hydantoinase/oxoprolinase family protein [Stella humosa]ROQ00022.1 N-methylhydantoinase A/oxoprolinase/acetone carboxylase beta subunit [Stella humosa]BBK30746.1 hydantoinase [Stella humosa]
MTDILRIGIDVGGTNTDAVLIQGGSVRHAVKTATTADVMGGILATLRRLLDESGTAGDAVGAVMIGTTHFTNAVVQRRGLARTAGIRISLPAARTLPAFVDWPADLRAVVAAPSHAVRGGYEVDGQPIAPFDADAVRAAARAIRADGTTAVAITGAFSPLNPDQEQRAAAILAEEWPDAQVTLSHELGRIGLLARENVSLLNAALVPMARRTVAAFADALAAVGIAAPLFITQNDGTVVQSDEAAAYPVRSFASGPTNSLRGAAFLSGLDRALVVDVGGTTSDVGSLVNGFPREANNVVEVGGVRTLFRMPDLLSIGLGGGTLCNPADPNDIGPVSVGFRLTERARVFGGPDLTTSDVAVAAGLVELGDRSRVADLDPAYVRAAIARIHAMIADAVDRMKSDAADIPLIAVGGGAFLVPDSLPGVSEVVRVPHQGVANALGAAIAQVSGEVDQIFRDLPREAAMARARELAEARAVRAGADRESLKLVEMEDIPLAYLPGNSLRVRARVVGDVA